MITTDTDTAAAEGPGPSGPAARLRERVMQASNDHVAAHLASDNAGFDSIEDSFAAVGTAADALIAYHRAASAVEALEAGPCYVGADKDGMPTCRTQYAANDMNADELALCDRCRALEAAQARLALYSSEAR